MLFAETFDALSQFQRTLDAFRTSGWLEPGPSSGGAYPPLNVFRKGDDHVIVLEIPGVRREDLQIEVHRNTLRISGVKSASPDDRTSMHRRERLSGRFDRSIALPVEIDSERVRAECRDGILAIVLPRAEHDKPRSISVG